MEEREVKSKTHDELTAHVASLLDHYLQDGRGFTLYIIKTPEEEGIHQTRVQVKECKDLDQLLDLIRRPDIAYPEFLMLKTLDEAIDTAESYGETGLSSIAEQPGRWHETTGFEHAEHLRAVIQAVTEPQRGEKAELITLHAPMSADTPFHVAKASEWSIALEQPTEGQLGARVIATIDSLRRMLS